mgnify:CR=1 FL=1
MATQNEIYEVLKKHCRDDYYSARQIEELLDRLGHTINNVNTKLRKLSTYFKEIDVKYMKMINKNKLIRKYKYIEGAKNA